MNKKRIITAAVIIVIIAAVVVTVRLISGDYGSNKYTGELYFFNETKTGIEAENREVRYRDGQDLAEGIIKGLMRGPEEPKHQRIIENNTSLLGVDGVDTGNVTVNFTREFITGDSSKDMSAVYAVVKSLCATDYIRQVKVIIEGKELSMDGGAIVGFLSDEDINLPTDTRSSEMREVTLYFPPKEGYTLRREVRSIRVNDQQPLAQYIINELIKGPENEELEGVLNKDTVLLSVETSENICFINFKSDFIDKNSGSAEKEKTVIFSIVDALTELDAIDRVQFLMDGKRVASFGNINISSMFGRDESIIE